MGLLDFFLPSHEEAALKVYKNFVDEEESYRNMAKQYTNFAIANPNEFGEHLTRMHDIFITEIKSIKKPITFRHKRYSHTPSQAISYMEDFIMEIMKHNFK